MSGVGLDARSTRLLATRSVENMRETHLKRYDPTCARRKRWQVLIAAILVASLLGGLQETVLADPTIDAARASARTFRERLDVLAAWCDERDLTAEAAQTRGLVPPAAPDRIYVPVLPRKYNAEVIPATASPDQREWAKQLSTLRRSHANTLWTLARTAYRQKRTSLALDLALAALRADPDHEALRRFFGFRRYQDHWRTEYEIRRLQAGHVWHAQYGWLPAGHVARYEGGQRFHAGRWITAEQEAAASNRWVVESEHYRIHTNHSIEAAVQLAERLEEFHWAWRQLFLGFVATPRQVEAMFQGNAARLPTQRHEVAYYRDRATYIASLAPTNPGIERSVGLYSPSERTAYFYPPLDDEGWRNVWHEVTHQLFQETLDSVPAPGQQANYWIVEGIATYMESFRTEGEYYVLGGMDYDLRLQAAAVRLLRDDFHVPLDELCGWGRHRFQQDARLPMLYSQAAGLTHFLVHAEEGRHRDALVNYLAAVYSGRDTPRALADLTGQSYSQLDDEYRQFIHLGVDRLRKTLDEE